MLGGGFALFDDSQAIDCMAASNGSYPDEKRINLCSVTSRTALSTLRNAWGFLRKPMLWNKQNPSSD